MGSDEVAHLAVKELENMLPTDTQYVVFIFDSKDAVTGNLMMNPTVHAGQLIWVASMLNERGLFMVRKGLAREQPTVVPGNLSLPDPRFRQ